jgi:hypothetical protein
MKHAYTYTPLRIHPGKLQFDMWLWLAESCLNFMHNAMTLNGYVPWDMVQSTLMFVRKPPEEPKGKWLEFWPQLPWASKRPKNIRQLPPHQEDIEDGTQVSRWTSYRQSLWWESKLAGHVHAWHVELEAQGWHNIPLRLAVFSWPCPGEPFNLSGCNFLLANIWSLFPALLASPPRFHFEVMNYP